MLYVVVSLTIETVCKLLHKQVQNLGYNRQRPDLQIITFKLSFTEDNKTDNVHIKLILRHVHGTILTREKQYVLHILSAFL